MIAGALLAFDGAPLQANPWAHTKPNAGAVRSALIGPFEERIFTAPNTGSARRGTAEARALLPAFDSTPGPGCKNPWLMVGAVAWVCSDSVSLSELPSIAAHSTPAPSPDGLPFRYYKIGLTGARTYRELADVDEGRVAAELEPDFIVAISRTARWHDQEFGLSSKGTWLAVDELLPLRSSLFQGASVTELSQIAWVRRNATPEFNAPSGLRKGSLRRHTQVTVLDTTRRNAKTWLKVGELKWLRSDDVWRPSLAPTPTGLGAGERWIDIELQAQVLTAYQGATPVFTTLVSTGRGRENSPLATPKGEHRIWVKLRTTDMSNLEEEEAQRYYAIQDVPWVMYFKAGYGLHGAFWHSSFGEVRSHGCVNLAPRDAEWLFHWVSPQLPAGWSAVLPTAHDLGTRVVIR